MVKIKRTKGQTAIHKRKLNNVRRSSSARKLKQESQNWLRSPITYGGEPLF
jgi:hypothetical protein